MTINEQLNMMVTWIPYSSPSIVYLTLSNTNFLLMDLKWTRITFSIGRHYIELSVLESLNLKKLEFSLKFFLTIYILWIIWELESFAWIRTIVGVTCHILDYCIPELLNFIKNLNPHLNLISLISMKIWVSMNFWL